MSFWLTMLLAGKTRRSPARCAPARCAPARCAATARPVRLELETLESRLTPTVTYNGGALLPHVEAQAVFLGSDWVSNSTYVQQSQYLNGFVHAIVNSSFMDMLTNAGYNVGRGTASAPATDPIGIQKSAGLTDAAIQTDLQLAINAGIVQAPDANRLYVVFVEDNVSVSLADGSTSVANFLSYHGAFSGHTAAGQPVYVRYAVVPYPGGTVGNLHVPGLSAEQSITECTSHEIADAVTDPDVDFAAPGWYDNSLKDGGLYDEAAEVVDREYVTLDGYVVQRVADKEDQGMTPTGAAPLRPVAFALLKTGQLYEHSASGWIALLQGNAVTVSSQGIDDDGNAMVDVVLNSGSAYEYHDQKGWVSLGTNVKQACADQGVSYVLSTSGQLREYHDDTATWSAPIASDVAFISAGTDRYGSNTADFVTKTGEFYEYSDSTGLHALCGNAVSVSAGTGGVALVLLKNGIGYEFSETGGAFIQIGTKLAQVSVGTDPTGAAMFDLVSATGVLTEYRNGTGWQTLATGVATVGQARAGLLDVVYATGTAYEHTASGWTMMTTGVRAET